MHSVDLANIPYLYRRYGRKLRATYKCNGALGVDERAWTTFNPFVTAIANDITNTAKINLANHLTTNNK